MQNANTSSGFSSLVVLLMLALKYICGQRDRGGDVMKRRNNTLQQKFDLNSGKSSRRNNLTCWEMHLLRRKTDATIVRFYIKVDIHQ